MKFIILACFVWIQLFTSTAKANFLVLGTRGEETRLFSVNRLSVISGIIHHARKIHPDFAYQTIDLQNDFPVPNRYLKLSLTDYAFALDYLDRTLKNKPAFILNDPNGLRNGVIVSLTLAGKHNQDDKIENGDSNTSQRLPLKDHWKLEVNILEGLDYKLRLNEEQTLDRIRMLMKRISESKKISDSDFWDEAQLLVLEKGREGTTVWNEENLSPLWDTSESLRKIREVFPIIPKIKVLGRTPIKASRDPFSFKYKSRFFIISFTSKEVSIWCSNTQGTSLKELKRIRVEEEIIGVFFLIDKLSLAIGSRNDNTYIFDLSKFFYWFLE
jgi:hypothetical protein